VKELDEIDAIVARLVDACRKALANKETAAYEFLVRTQRIHPRVVMHSMVGLIPLDLETADFFAPSTEQAALAVEAERNAPKGPGRPRKGPTAADARLESLKEARAVFEKALGDSADKLVFFYTDAKHRLSGVRVWNWRDATGHFVTLHGDGGLFNNGLFNPGERPQQLGQLDGPLLVVTSELDNLQLQSVGARFAEMHGYPAEHGYLRACACGWPSVTDGGAVRQTARMPVVLYNEQGFPMVERITQQLTVRASAAVPTLELLLRPSADAHAALSKLEELIQKSRLACRPYAAVKDEVDDIRDIPERQLKQYRAHRWAGDVIIRDLQERGKLLFDGRVGYIFLHEDKSVTPIDPDDSQLDLLLAKFGVIRTDTFFKHISQALHLAAQKSGEPRQVHTFSYYDSSKYTLWLFDLQSAVYRISPDGVTRVDNGTAGVMFRRTRDWTPFEIDLSALSKDLLEHRAGDRVARDLFEGLHPDISYLRADEQAWLLLCWIASLCFRELMPTRPILALIGPAGSAKSSLLRRVGRLLFGDSFQLMQLSPDAKDFDAAATNLPLVGLDNADNPVAWLADRLAVIATGGSIKRRKLYTTNSLIEYPVTAYLGITSRTPHFRREDVADRLLVFHFHRFKQFEAEADLLDELHHRRDERLTELVRYLHFIVKALHKQAGKKFPSKSRMADFAQFVLKIAHADGRGEQMESMLDRLAAEQLSFSTENEPLFDLIDRWLDSRGNSGRDITTSELYTELAFEAAHTPALPFDFKSARDFGMALTNHWATLEALYHAEQHKGHARTRWVRFYKVGETGETLTREGAQKIAK
jgi:hypothetical protein